MTSNTGDEATEPSSRATSQVAGTSGAPANGGPKVRRHRVRHFFVEVVASMAALGIAVWLTPGLRIIGDLFFSLLFAVLFTAGLNAALRPLMVRLLNVLGWLGAVLIAFFADALIMFMAIKLSPGFTGDTPGRALLAAWIFSIITAFVNWLLVTETDEAFVAHNVRIGQRTARRRADEVAKRLATGAANADGTASHDDSGAAAPATGVIFLQLDGVPGPVLDMGIKSGNLPTLSRWTRSGEYSWTEWVARVPSTTPVSQAGILHGNNDNMPAFRWYEKRSGRLLVANHPPDAKVMEDRVSTGSGLLAHGGWSISNLFSGDAENRYMVISGLSNVRSGLGESEEYNAFLANPFGFSRSMIRTIGEMVKELFQRRVQVRRGVEPRIHRHKDFVFLRGVTNVMLRDLNTSLVIQAMMQGVPSVYCDYVDYDEVAHHAGVLRHESMRSLEGLDRVVAMLEAAAAQAPRPYRFVLLSDHGQSQGATFLQRYGLKLEDLVRELMKGEASVTAATASIEGWGPVNIFVKQLRETAGLSGRLITRATARRDTEGEVAYGPGMKEAGAITSDENSDLVVVGSGNLGGIWFARHPQKMTWEEIGQAYPGLVSALSTHPGIGFLVVNTESRGPLAIGRSGIHFLAEDLVEGSSPLTGFGPYARGDFLRAASFPDAPDIYVNSFYDEANDEVAAFEELVGCHGGVGGWQTRPFLMHPADWPIAGDLLDEHGRLAGADVVHQQLVRWLEEFAGRPTAWHEAGEPSKS